MSHYLRRVGPVGLAAGIIFALTTQAHAVDGVKLINQAKANAGGVTPGDAPGFPVTISQAGSYRLSGNLVVPSGPHAIHITADNVTLDLNGFSIIGSGSGTGSGIVVEGHNHVTVVNGSVRSMGGSGFLFTGNTHRVENMHVTNNGGHGIVVGFGSIVKNCTANSNTGIGIIAFAGSTVSGNTADSNGNHGISTDAPFGTTAGSTVVGNTARNNGGLGLEMSDHTGYVNNVLTGNNGGDANPQTTGGLEMGTNVCGSDTICP